MKYLRKKAMAMIMAIMVIVIIGTIMALSLSMTTQTTKRNLETYLYEQSEILADSAREYAMYKIGNTSCTPADFNITAQDAFYDITIKTRYVTSTASCGTRNFTADTDPDLQNPTAVIDVTVAIDTNNTKTSEAIRFYKRYIETIKP